MKKTLSRKIMIAVMAAALATPLSMGMAPQTAEAGSSILGNVIGAAINGAIYSSQLNQEINQINNTEEGRNAYFAAMKKELGVNTDWALNNRVSNIMTNLTAAIGSIDATVYDKPYQYFINKDDSFNASCSLGHNMTINQGLFNVLDNDAEIAVVLGHEMGHGQKDHPAKGAKKSVGPAILQQAMGGNILGTLAANLWNNQGITKPMEWEADNLSFDYITHSDYNPGATAAVWQRVIDKYGDKTPFVIGGSDHPSNTARRDNYEKKLEAYSGGHVSVTKDGIVEVNNQEFCVPAASGGMSSHERAYFVEGNLAAAFHNGQNASAATAEGSTVRLGAQPIMTCVSGDEDAQTLADRLNKIKDGKK